MTDSPDPQLPDTPEDWADLLRREWGERARSPVRDFFVTSSPGWSDRERASEDARTAFEFLITGLDLDALSQSSALEIGCGTGLLAPHVLARAKDYTGLDISADMVAEARSRCTDLEGARFFESDGLRLPEPARDRRYGLILSVAVLIHCPLPVVFSLVEDAWLHLAPGGGLRFQVLADPEDRSGLETPPEVLETVAAQAEDTATAAPREALEMIERAPYYLGHPFRGDELRALVRDATGAEAELHRPHPMHWWAALARP